LVAAKERRAAAVEAARADGDADGETDEFWHRIAALDTEVAGLVDLVEGLKQVWHLPPEQGFRMRTGADGLYLGARDVSVATLGAHVRLDVLPAGDPAVREVLGAAGPAPVSGRAAQAAARRGGGAGADSAGRSAAAAGVSPASTPGQASRSQSPASRAADSGDGPRTGSPAESGGGRARSSSAASMQGDVEQAYLQADAERKARVRWAAEARGDGSHDAVPMTASEVFERSAEALSSGPAASAAPPGSAPPAHERCAVVRLALSRVTSAVLVEGFGFRSERAGVPNITVESLRVEMSFSLRATLAFEAGDPAWRLLEGAEHFSFELHELKKKQTGIVSAPSWVLRMVVERTVPWALKKALRDGVPRELGMLLTLGAPQGTTPTIQAARRTAPLRLRLGADVRLDGLPFALLDGAVGAHTSPEEEHRAATEFRAVSEAEAERIRRDPRARFPCTIRAARALAAAHPDDSVLGSVAAQFLGLNAAQAACLHRAQAGAKISPPRLGTLAAARRYALVNLCPRGPASSALAGRLHARLRTQQRAAAVTAGAASPVSTRTGDVLAPEDCLLLDDATGVAELRDRLCREWRALGDCQAVLEFLPVQFRSSSLGPGERGRSLKHGEAAMRASELDVPSLMRAALRVGEQPAAVRLTVSRLSVDCSLEDVHACAVALRRREVFDQQALVVGSARARRAAAAYAAGRRRARQRGHTRHESGQRAPGTGPAAGGGADSPAPSSRPDRSLSASAASALGDGEADSPVTAPSRDRSASAARSLGFSTPGSDAARRGRVGRAGSHLFADGDSVASSATDVSNALRPLSARLKALEDEEAAVQSALASLPGVVRRARAAVTASWRGGRSMGETVVQVRSVKVSSAPGVAVTLPIAPVLWAPVPYYMGMQGRPDGGVDVFVAFAPDGSALDPTAAAGFAAALREAAPLAPQPDVARGRLDVPLHIDARSVRVAVEVDTAGLVQAASQGLIGPHEALVLSTGSAPRSGSGAWGFAVDVGLSRFVRSTVTLASATLRVPLPAMLQHWTKLVGGPAEQEEGGPDAGPAGAPRAAEGTASRPPGTPRPALSGSSTPPGPVAAVASASSSSSSPPPRPPSGAAGRAAADSTPAPADPASAAVNAAAGAAAAVLPAALPPLLAEGPGALLLRESVRLDLSMQVAVRAHGGTVEPGVFGPSGGPVVARNRLARSRSVEGTEPGSAAARRRVIGSARTPSTGAAAAAAASVTAAAATSASAHASPRPPRTPLRPPPAGVSPATAASAPRPSARPLAWHAVSLHVSEPIGDSPMGGFAAERTVMAIAGEVELIPLILPFAAPLAPPHLGGRVPSGGPRRGAT